MKYIDLGHVYVNNDGEPYSSVTQIIKKYEPYKNWQEIAEKFAKKHKKSVEDVQALWKEEGRKAVEKGVKFHEDMEKLYTDKGEWEIEGVIYKVHPSHMEDGVKLAIPLKLDLGIYPELIVYSHKYKVAGQADLIEIVDGFINIKDYKTSKEIKTESYKHWSKGHEMMKAPLSHLMNCNFSHYSLQLNIYMSLLKAHNPKLKMGKMEIYHVKDSNDPFGDLTTKVYEVPRLQKEAKAILEHHLKTHEYQSIRH